MPRIYLIGYRGTGKTTVGRRLAAALGWAFTDADADLEARAGKSIRDIFAADGELAFRDLEAAVLTDLSTRANLVVATGGGVILRPTNCDVLKTTGYVAWLRATPATVWARIQADPTTIARRPALAGGGFAEVVQLMAVRGPLYAAVADTAIDVDAVSPEAAAALILSAWNGGTTCR